MTNRLYGLQTEKLYDFFYFITGMTMSTEVRKHVAFVGRDKADTIIAVTELMNIVADILGIPFTSSKDRIIPTSIGKLIYAVEYLKKLVVDMRLCVENEYQFLRIHCIAYARGKYSPNLEIPFNVDVSYREVRPDLELTAIERKSLRLVNSLYQNNISPYAMLPELENYFSDEELQTYSSAIVSAILDVLNQRTSATKMLFCLDQPRTVSIETETH